MMKIIVRIGIIFIIGIISNPANADTLNERMDKDTGPFDLLETDTGTHTDANTDSAVETDSDTDTHTDDEAAPFSLGNIVLKGNGCPEGSMTDVVKNPDGYELSINFGEFIAYTDATSYAFANCNIAIPINLPPGIKVGLIRGAYRGLAFIPSGGRG